MLNIEHIEKMVPRDMLHAGSATNLQFVKNKKVQKMQYLGRAIHWSTIRCSRPACKFIFGGGQRYFSHCSS